VDNIPSSPANQAIEVNDEEILLHRDAVIATKISLQGFTESDGILKNHIHLFLDDFFQGRVFLRESPKSSLKMAIT
jgi:hypothetical protein